MSHNYITLKHKNYSIIIREYTHKIITYNTLFKLIPNTWSLIHCTSCSRNGSRE